MPNQPMLHANGPPWPLSDFPNTQHEMVASFCGIFDYLSAQTIFVAYENILLNCHPQESQLGEPRPQPEHSAGALQHH